MGAFVLEALDAHAYGPFVLETNVYCNRFAYDFWMNEYERLERVIKNNTYW